MEGARCWPRSASTSAARSSIAGVRYSTGMDDRGGCCSLRQAAAYVLAARQPRTPRMRIQRRDDVIRNIPDQHVRHTHLQPSLAARMMSTLGRALRERRANAAVHTFGCASSDAKRRGLWGTR
jgi:hypothetical protein